jgi:predicted adenylyl cyclase CyaB
MKEIEVKILEIKKQKVTDTLETLGAKKVFDGEVTTVFLDFQDGSIGKRMDVLRLRKMQDKTELTYKKVNVTRVAKEAEETNVEVSNFKATLAILQRLGLSVTEQMQKHRVSYKLDKARFDIDHYSGEFGFIPEFLEIEGDIEAIHRYAELLGFTPKDCLPWSTTELVNYYFNKK